MKETERQKVKLAAGDALIVVDLQNDFLAGGSLAVPCCNTVIPVLNRYLAEFAGRQLPIFATRDWHPANHCSFRTQGGRWPVHCVANSKGAQFPSELILPPWTVVISKGVAPIRKPTRVLRGLTWKSAYEDLACAACSSEDWPLIIVC